MRYISQSISIRFAVVFRAAAILMSLTGHTDADQISGYHIGNSLTWSALSPGFQSLFQNVGTTLDIGYHIRCGAPLGNIVADPTVRCVPAPAPFGDWLNALTQYDWGYVTLQTHAGMANDEIKAASDVVNTATHGGRNGQTRFFVYSAWPTKSDTLTYRQVRTQPLTTVAFNTDAFLGELHTQLKATYPSVDFGYIPAGEVLLRLDDLLRATPTGGLTNAWDLYSDIYHLNSAAGRYVAHATMASVLTGRRPQDLVFSGVFSGVDPAFISLANAAIVDVIANDLRVNPLAVPEPTCLIGFASLAVLYFSLRKPFGFAGRRTSFPDAGCTGGGHLEGQRTARA